MYYCVICNERIDLPSHNAKCIKCALMPRKERERIEEEQRQARLLKIKEEEDKKFQEKERRKDELRNALINKLIEDKFIVSFGGNDRYFENTYVRKIKYLQEISDRRYLDYLDQNGTASKFLSEAQSVGLKAKIIVTKVVISNYAPHYRVSTGHGEVIIDIIVGIENNPLLLEKAKIIAASNRRYSMLDNKSKQFKIDKIHFENEVKRFYSPEYRSKYMMSFKYRHVCYSCGNSVDNTMNIQCPSCRWLKCKCGACNCNQSLLELRYEWYED